MLEESKTREIFRHLAEAVKYLHEMNIVHKDIKLENILFDNTTDLNVAITDFGFSLIRTPDDSLITSYNGTTNYASPELLFGIPHDGYKSDIWALGVCLYILLTGEYPFIGNSMESFKECVMEERYILQLIHNDDAADLVVQMLKIEKSERYDINQVLNSKWLKTTSL